MILLDGTLNIALLFLALKQPTLKESSLEDPATHVSDFWGGGNNKQQSLTELFSVRLLLLEAAF